ncbi:hypothetical protein Plhal304r1_c060g0146261 [Plasmopara halstedii]
MQCLSSLDGCPLSGELWDFECGAKLLRMKHGQVHEYLYFPSLQKIFPPSRLSKGWILSISILMMGSISSTNGSPLMRSWRCITSTNIEYSERHQACDHGIWIFDR